MQWLLPLTSNKYMTGVKWKMYKQHTWIPPMLLAMLLIFFGGGHVLYNVYLYHKADMEYMNLAEQYMEEAVNSSEAAEKAIGAAGTPPALAIDWESLSAVNPEIFAWLYYQDEHNGISISLPVVKPPAENPEKYLHETFDGTRNPAGCLFISAEASFAMDTNVFIYGHNMRNGSMFGSLKNLYRHPENIRNTEFFLYFPDGSVRAYQLLSVVRTEDGSLFYDAPEPDGLDAYIEKLRDASVYRPERDLDKSMGENVAVSDHSLLTLSTCIGKPGSKDRILITGFPVPTQ